MLQVQQVREPKEIDFVKVLDFFQHKKLACNLLPKEVQFVGLHCQALPGVNLLCSLGKKNFTPTNYAPCQLAQRWVN